MTGGQLAFTILAVAAMWAASSSYRHYLKCELEIRRAESMARSLENAVRILEGQDADFRAANLEALGKSSARATFEPEAQK